MRLPRSTARLGYTLLEVLLAAIIAVIMMAALYVAMDVQIRQMDEGRTRVEKSTLARALFTRIGNDLTPSLAPIQPVTSPTSTTAAAGATGTPATGAASTTPMTTAPTSTSTSTTNLVFQIGVKGDSGSVAIYQTRMARQVVTPPDDNSGNQNPYASDIRRICYFMPSSHGGLARQEIRMVTSDQVDDVPQDIDDFSKVIAEEVQQFSVRYYDGASWADSWDGSTPGPDGKTPQGPPRAIEITMQIQLPGADDLKTFKHVIAFPAAPGAADQSSSASTTSP